MDTLSRRKFTGLVSTGLLAAACSSDLAQRSDDATACEGACAALESFMVENLRPEDIFILSDRGYFSLLPPQLYTSTWSAAKLRAVSLPEEATKLRMRSRAAFQLSHASAPQVNDSLAHIADAMELGGLGEVPLDQIRAAANAALPLVEAREDVVMMWAKKGGFYAEMFIVPVPRAHMEQIYALFLPEENAFRAADAQAGRFNETELRLMNDGVLTENAVHEARALRLATMGFELAIDVFREDIGSWLGNIPIPFGLGPETIVCTDESLTMTMLVRHLEDLGLLHHFRLDQGRLGHRWTKIETFFYDGKKPLSDHFGVMLVGDFGRRFALDSWVQDGGEPSHFVSLDDWNDHTEQGKDLVGLPSDPQGFFAATVGRPADVVADRSDFQTEPRAPQATAEIQTLATELGSLLSLEGLWHVAFGYYTLPGDLQYDTVTAEHLEALAEHYADANEIDERFNHVTILGQAWSPVAAAAYGALAPRFEHDSIPFESLRLAAQIGWNQLKAQPTHGVSLQLPWMDADHQLQLWPLTGDELSRLRATSAEAFADAILQTLPIVRERPGSFEAAASAMMAFEVIDHPALQSFGGRLVRLGEGDEAAYGALLAGDAFGSVLTTHGAGIVSIDDTTVRPAPTGA